MEKNKVDPVLLRSLLRYDPETGKLFWRPRPLEMFSDAGHTAKHTQAKWNSRYAGKEAFTYLSQGYPMGRIHRKPFLAHRVIWAMAHGRWPENEIDHINGNRSDNRLSNLRESTRSENCYNKTKQSNNRSGHKGVSWSGVRSRWMATICVEKRQIFLGYFDDVEVAGRAYTDAARKYHGEFARVS